MTDDDTADLGPRRHSALGRLLRLPFVAFDAAEAVLEGVQQLPRLQHAVTSRLDVLDSGVRQLIALLPAIAGEIEGIGKRVDPITDQVRTVEDALALLPALAADLQRTRETVEPQHDRVATIEHTLGRLETEILELRRVLTGLKDDVQEAAEALPDPDAPGPLERAREALTGG